VSYPPPPPAPQWQPERPFATKHRTDKVHSIVKWVIVVAVVGAASVAGMIFYHDSNKAPAKPHLFHFLDLCGVLGDPRFDSYLPAKLRYSLSMTAAEMSVEVAQNCPQYSARL
jgi:hypothetical protein